MDVLDGHLVPYRTIVAAEILGDLLEQADELLRTGYKDAAAALAGAALENGLRSIGAGRGVDLGATRGLDALNRTLASEGAYTAVRQKQIDAWRTLRNAAAHGDTALYTEAEVRAMIDGVRSFLADALG